MSASPSAWPTKQAIGGNLARELAPDVQQNDEKEVDAADAHHNLRSAAKREGKRGRERGKGKG